MIYYKLVAQKRSFGKIDGVLIAAILFAIPVTIFLMSNQTIWFNRAAGPANPAIANLNSAGEIVITNNPNGTMGPATWLGNASNALPSYLRGTLFFKVIDPPQGTGRPDNPGSQGQRPTESFHPTNALPTQAQRNGPQTVTALNLTITKVEVHMAYQGTPGKPSTTPSQNQPVDHWETLNITSPVTIDLVSLAASHDFSPLGITSLAAGRYTEVRLYVDSATATLADGSTTVNLTILGKNNIVRVVRSFTIVAGQQTSLTMDFDAQHSVIKAGEQYLLKPVVARLIEE